MRCSKRGQQKPSTRLCDRVLIRERMKNKNHDYVQKLRAFCKARTVSELTLTPIRRVLIKGRFELIFGHSSQMLTTWVVKKLYHRDMKHIRNNL